jgi:Concanavalin A-like lectin/glucanases superfamily
MTFDGDLVGTDQGKIYVNGVLETMDNIFPWPAAPNNHLQDTTGSNFVLARRTSDQLRNLDGRLEDFRLYNYVLSQGQINFIYNNGSGTSE